MALLACCRMLPEAAAILSSPGAAPTWQLLLSRTVHGVRKGKQLESHLSPPIIPPPAASQAATALSDSPPISPLPAPAPASPTPFSCLPPRMSRFELEAGCCDWLCLLVSTLGVRQGRLPQLLAMLQGGGEGEAWGPLTPVLLHILARELGVMMALPEEPQADTPSLPQVPLFDLRGESSPQQGWEGALLCLLQLVHQSALACGSVAPTAEGQAGPGAQVVAVHVLEAALEVGGGLLASMHAFLKQRQHTLACN